MANEAVIQGRIVPGRRFALAVFVFAYQKDGRYFDKFYF